MANPQDPSTFVPPRASSDKDADGSPDVLQRIQGTLEEINDKTERKDQQDAVRERTLTSLDRLNSVLEKSVPVPAETNDLPAGGRTTPTLPVPVTPPAPAVTVNPVVTVNAPATTTVKDGAVPPSVPAWGSPPQPAMMSSGRRNTQMPAFAVEPYEIPANAPAVPTAASGRELPGPRQWPPFAIPIPPGEVPKGPIPVARMPGQDKAGLDLNKPIPVTIVGDATKEPGGNSTSGLPTPQQGTGVRGKETPPVVPFTPHAENAKAGPGGVDVSRQGGTGNWMNRLFGKLFGEIGGGNKAHQDAQEKLRRTRQRVFETEAEVHEAPGELRRARRDYRKQQEDLRNKEASGKGVSDEEMASLSRARSRLEGAKHKYEEAPRQHKQAKDDLKAAKQEAAWKSGAGGMLGAGSEIASGLGMERTGSTLGMLAQSGGGVPWVALLQELKKKGEDVKEGARLAGRAFQSERAGDVVGNAMGAGEKVFSTTPLEPLFKFGRVVAETVEKLRDMSEQLTRTNFQFAEFSGAMSRVRAEKEMRDVMLSHERGERRAASARTLAEAQSRLDRNLAPFEDGWANIKGEVLGAFSNWVSEVIEAIKGQGKTTPEAVSFTDWWMNNMMNNWDEGPGGRPGRFPKPATAWANTPAPTSVEGGVAKGVMAGFRAGS